MTVEEEEEEEEEEDDDDDDDDDDKKKEKKKNSLRQVQHLIIFFHIQLFLVKEKKRRHFKCLAGQCVIPLSAALRYKLEDRRFDSPWCHWKFSLKKSFLPHCGPGVDSASNRNEC